MGDRELYNYIKANYRPEKETTVAFNLKDYPAKQLAPQILNGLVELQKFIDDYPTHNAKLAFITYFDEEIIFNFHNVEFDQVENLTLNKAEYFHIIREIDMEAVEKEFRELILFMENFKAS